MLLVCCTLRGVGRRLAISTRGSDLEPAERNERVHVGIPKCVSAIHTISQETFTDRPNFLGNFLTRSVAYVDHDFNTH
jgi:hypothetical protein